MLNAPQSETRYELQGYYKPTIPSAKVKALALGPEVSLQVVVVEFTMVMHDRCFWLACSIGTKLNCRLYSCFWNPCCYSQASIGKIALDRSCAICCGGKAGKTCQRVQMSAEIQTVDRNFWVFRAVPWDTGKLAWMPSITLAEIYPLLLVLINVRSKVSRRTKNLIFQGWECQLILLSNILKIFE